MDSKRLAKSKRAHSAQNNKRNNQKPQIEAKKGPLLPSNWDRYSDEEESSGEQNNPNQKSGLVLPKSRGADYRHLIAEAESQPIVWVDDVVADKFSQGVSSMLSVRGDGILACLGDHSFMIDHTTTWNPSFVSLNLHVLADQLETMGLSDRLFIEPHLLPPDLETKAQSSGRSVEIIGIEAQLDTLLGELDISPDFRAKTDTWGPLNNVNLDDELDDLLRETAIVASGGYEEPSSDPKLLNDFDSWLDTL